MRTKKLLLASLVAITIALGFIYDYSFSGKGVTFIVKNVGTESIRSMVVHITGHSLAIGDIEPGTSKWVVLNPTSESHVELTFSGHPRLMIDCYFEHGYSGTLAAEITVEKVVTIKDSTVF
ncbi:hypothetical protein [Rugamonas rubra]|uniref:hypothetical protein n=1 Tax=Rugamonas rubra TaxID=758825 RepID=UPI001113351E|nr:hypothetical protein [Rugamonas rubra]